MEAQLSDTKHHDLKSVFQSPKIYKEVCYLLLSFFLPLLLLILLFSGMGFSPFTKNGLTILSFDMQSQYISYIRYYRNLLLQGKSFLYTQGKVFGGDFLSVFTYYLASPFNFLVIFFSESSIPDFLLITSILKMAFSSMNFYLMARFLYKRCDFSYLVFALSYGMVSYSMVYIANFMWLDGVMILPLIILGLFYVKEGRRLWLYPLCIFYGLMTGWYIGFMLCVFTVMFFLYLLFREPGKWKDRKPFFLRAVILSVLGGMMASAFWFTAFLHFSGTKAQQSFPNFFFNSFSMFFTGFLENNYATYRVIEQNHGYVSMFTGMISLVFALRYFLNSSFSKRERIASLIFSVVLFLCTMNSILNALFHGGREPTWFPGRYTFVIGFFVCYLAQREMDSYVSSPWYSFLLPLLMPLIVLPIVLYTDNSNYFNGKEEYLRYTLSVPSLLIYLGCTLLSSVYPFIRNQKFISGKGNYAKAVLSLCLLPLAGYSLYRGDRNILSKNIEGNQFQSMETYLADDSLTPVFETLKEYDSSSSYRMEALFNRDGAYNTINNNPMFYSYHGLNHFSSSEKKTVEEYFQKLGFQYNYYFEKYEGGSTAAINSFLNVRYLIDSDKSSKTQKPVFVYNTDERATFRKMDLVSPLEGYSYYENKKVLPYAFVIDDDDYSYVSEGKRNEDDSVFWYDHFQYQNEMFKTMDHRLEKDIFYPIPLTQKADSNLTLTKDEDGTYHIDAKKGDSIVFEFTVPEEAYDFNLYFGEKYQSNKTTVYFDGRYYENNTYWHKGIRGFEDNNSHRHNLRFIFKQDVKDFSLRPEVYYENLDVLNEYLDDLRKGGAYDLETKSTMLSTGYHGTFEITEGNQDKTLLFTFPNERGISIKIDGKKQKVLTRMNIFSAVDFSSLSLGKHTLEISYTDVGLDIGLVLSVFSFAGMIYFCVYEHRRHLNSVE